MFGRIFYVHRFESAGADMQHNFGPLHSFALQSCQKLGREVQASRWGRNRSWLPGKDSLVAFDVRRFIGALDVRGQRNVSMPLDRLVDVTTRHQPNQPGSPTSRLEDLGTKVIGERDDAMWLELGSRRHHGLVHIVAALAEK